MTTTNEVSGDNALARSQDFERGKTNEGPRGILIEKARRSDFISFYPSDEPWALMPVLKDPETGEHLIMSFELAGHYANDVASCFMIPYMHRDGQISIWPLNSHPGPWSQSLLKIIRDHAGKWHRIIADMRTHRYTCFLSSAIHTSPVWHGTLLEIYNMIPESSRISDPAHRILARLRGEDL